MGETVISSVVVLWFPFIYVYIPKETTDSESIPSAYSIAVIFTES